MGFGLGLGRIQIDGDEGGGGQSREKSKGMEAGPGLHSASSVGRIPGTAGEGQMGFVKGTGLCVAACPGVQAAEPSEIEAEEMETLNPPPPELDLPRLLREPVCWGPDRLPWGA